MDNHGKEIGRFQEALLEAFKLSELEELLVTIMCVRLEEIAPPRETFAVTCLEVVEWAYRHDRQRELVEAACSVRPRNHRLHEIRTEMSKHDSTGRVLGSQLTSEEQAHGKQRDRRFLASSAYDSGIERLEKLIKHFCPELFESFAIYQMEWRTILEEELIYGSSENTRVRKNRIFSNLDRLALECADVGLDEMSRET